MGGKRKYCDYSKGEKFGMSRKIVQKNDVANLMGEMDLEEAAEVSGCTPDAFRRNLDRRKADFVNAMKALCCCLEYLRRGQFTG